MLLARTGVALLALMVLSVCARADAQVITGEVVITTPPPDDTLPPPPSTAPAGTVPPPPASGVAYIPPGSTPSSGAYAPPGSVAYVPAEIPRERRVIDWSIVGTGIGLFAGGWLATWISTVVWYDRTTHCTSTGWFSYSCTHDGGPGGDGLAWSFLPVIGPWLMLTDPYLDTPGEIAFPIIAGIVQDVGLIMLIVGLVTQTTETVMVEARRSGDWRIGGGATPGSAYGTFDLTF